MDYDKKKESNPLDTIERIKSILKKIGIDELQELYLTRLKKENSTESLRLYLKEDFYCGTNGKGTTLDFARASSYGEFMERIQYPYILQFTPPDSKKMTVREFKNSCNVYHFLDSKNINNKDYIKRITDIASAFKTNPVTKCIETIPYYHVNEDKIEYISPRLRWYASISTGTSAGNTDYEALVEGLSEIFERYILTKAILEPVTFPDIPEEEYMRYDSINKIVNYIKSNGYNIHIKDASLNGLFPVICVLITKDNDKSYYATFGAHPYLPVAIERCFTEALQGFDISNKVISHIVFKEDGLRNNNIPAAKLDNSLHHRFTELNPQFFTLKPKYSFNINNWNYSENKTNEQLVKYIIKKLLDSNYNIYIRNVNFLNFPAFQVYIPELMSNFLSIDKEKGQYIRFNYDKCNTIIKENINLIPDINEMLDFFNYFFHMRMRFSNNDYKNIEIQYAIILIQSKNYNKALNVIDSILKNKNFESKQRILNFLKDFVILKQENKNKKEIKKYLYSKYGTFYTNKLIKLFFEKNGYKNIITMMKNKKLFEKISNKEGIKRKNEIIKNLLTEYSKNIPNQKEIKKIIFQ